MAPAPAGPGRKTQRRGGRRLGAKRPERAGPGGQRPRARSCVWRPRGGPPGRPRPGATPPPPRPPPPLRDARGGPGGHPAGPPVFGGGPGGRPPAPPGAPHPPPPPVTAPSFLRLRATAVGPPGPRCRGVGEGRQGCAGGAAAFGGRGPTGPPACQTKERRPGPPLFQGASRPRRPPGNAGIFSALSDKAPVFPLLFL